MDKRFDISSVCGELSELLGRSDPDASRESSRRSILSVLVAAGFDRARFYERCDHLAYERDPILVLVTQTARDEADAPAHLTGYGVPVTAAAMGYGPDSPAVVLADRLDFDGPLPPFIVDLDLEGRVWIDIRLRASGEEVGVLAVDWTGSKSDVALEGLRQLAGIGLMVGAHMQLRPRRRVQQLRETLRDVAAGRPEEDPSPEAILAAGARLIGRLMDARLTAMFEYHWSSGQLTKRFELDGLHSDVQQRADQVLTGDETYPVDRHLTGKAWSTASHRHVPLFDPMAKQVAELVEPSSLRRHRQYMHEDPYTLLYGCVGGLEPRFMVRLMNRVDSHLVPYVGERYMLDELLSELGAQLDKAVATHRTRSLEQATEITASSSNPYEVLEKVAPLFAREGVEDFLLLCHRPPATQFSFGASWGDSLRDLDMRTGTAWRLVSLYERAVTAGATPTLLDLSTAARARDRIAEALLQRKFRSVLVFPIVAGETRGALFVPLPESTPVRRTSLVEDCGAGRLSLIGAYARLLGEAVDTAVASARADGARQALGLLGHELATPVARLGSTAEAALVEIHRDIARGQQLQQQGQLDDAGDIIDDVRAAAAGYLGRIRLERRNVGAAMRLAPIVAQEADGRLELQFEGFDLAELVIEAIAQATTEANEDPTNVDASGRRRRAFHFTYGDSVQALGHCVGDPGLLQLALMNLLRNAAKYSMETDRSSRCVIEVGGEPQGQSNIVLVRNTGQGISPEEMDLIFEPWVRLGDGDGVIARRGMGLGLFLSRRIAYAHRGTVLCRRCVPASGVVALRPAAAESAELEAMLAALPRGSSRSRLEVGALRAFPPQGEQLRRLRDQPHTTEFELRIDSDLPEGAQVHEWPTQSSVGTVRTRGV